jgi:hypothetical protein
MHVRAAGPRPLPVNQILRVIRTFLLAALLASVAGCAPDLTALGQDHNSDCLTLTTPWGTETFERDGGCHYPPQGFMLVPVVPVLPGKS